MKSSSLFATSFEQKISGSKAFDQALKKYLVATHPHLQKMALEQLSHHVIHSKLILKTTHLTEHIT